MKKVLKLFVVIFIFNQCFAYADFIKPDAKIKPDEVIKIQLKSLMKNDAPSKDNGIKQTWEFAHPRNKMATGPLPRFTNMIKTPAYSILLNNLKFETKEIFNDGTNAGIAVRIEAQDNKAYTYMWSLEKIQDDGPLKNNWMTTGVSGPRLLAEGS